MTLLLEEIEQLNKESEENKQASKRDTREDYQKRSMLLGSLYRAFKETAPRMKRVLAQLDTTIKEMKSHLESQNGTRV